MEEVSDADVHQCVEARVSGARAKAVAGTHLSGTDMSTAFGSTPPSIALSVSIFLIASLSAAVKVTNSPWRGIRQVDVIAVLQSVGARRHRSPCFAWCVCVGLLTCYFVL